MARIFTIDFPFKDRSCKILVSIKENVYGIACIVRYLDEELKRLLPEGILQFELSGHCYCSTNVRNKQAEELVFCTSLAISEHLRIIT